MLPSFAGIRDSLLGRQGDKGTGRQGDKGAGGRGQGAGGRGQGEFASSSPLSPLSPPPLSP
ncbi:MAG: hypothetical protein KME31_02320 [Tolypothrix carrinoi HA7290-LM1]|nr:hypothetical protein [Tolypothrix carrinoi HA7290-LM1]